VATAWLRRRHRRIIPIVGIRKLEQLHDLLGSLQVELTDEHQARLDELSRIELGFPYELLRDPRASSSTATSNPRSSCPRPHHTSGGRPQESPWPTVARRPG
jgi:hypothetical protein